MNTVQWIDARSVEEAVALLSAPAANGTIAKAGGLDVLDLMKEGIVTPARIVNLQRIDALRGVQFSDASGLRLGALTTLAEIANDASIRRHYPALAAAAVHAATPQVRNAATIGGNLLQRPRCWYFRNELFHAARNEIGREQAQYGAIFDNATSTMVHASTPVTALVAYDARVHVVGKQGKSRTIALSDFLLPPDFDRDRDTTLAGDEVLTHVSVPPVAAQTTAAYHKQTERDSYDWPICDVAVVLTTGDRKVDAAKIVVGAVAPVPRRMTASEKLLLGREIDEQLAAEAGRLAVRDATPTAKNSYKVPVLEAVIRRTIMAAIR
ncbi:MAG TPA: FAD binding domain-containing protein [Steroidobacteraceae bacterium]|jgi:xanthine dehydrogenase YagS FAD-binding subunit